MTMMSGAQMLVHTLEDLGVEYLFGYPGGAVLDIYDALLDSKKIKHILARHEQGAAHMADGYARTTGKVGCCLVTSGPGATNTVTAIATAYMDSIPMVVVTGQVISPLIGSDAFQEVDTVGITRPIVKHSFLCQKASDIPKYLAQAFYLASTGRPGPVVVDVPKDCVRPSDKFEYPGVSEVKMKSYNPTKQGHKGQIKRACKLLTQASRPVLLVGGGVILGNAADKFNDFAKRVNMPVASTLMGLGVMSGEDPQFLGMVGMHGTYEANEAMHASDLVIAVAVRFDDRVTNNVKKFCPHAKLIHIDVDPASISKCVHADIPVVGDAKAVLAQLNECAQELDAKANSELDDWWQCIEVFRAKNCLAYEKTGPIKPQEAIEAVCSLLDDDAFITTDVGQHQMFTAQYYKFNKARHFITSGGLGTMGFGFPAAIGVKTAFPDSTVVCFTGDGSFQMNLQELGTCLQYKIPVKIIILNNHTLGMVRQWQSLFYDKRYAETDLNFNPDFMLLAAAYSHKGVRIQKREELQDKLKEALSLKDDLVIIEILVDTDAIVFPMQKKGGAMSDMILCTGDVK